LQGGKKGNPRKKKKEGKKEITRRGKNRQEE
jgi:hypothetical protein